MAQTRVKKVKIVDGKLTCRITKSCEVIFDTIEERDEHEKNIKHFRGESCEIDFKLFSDWQKHRNEDVNCKALTCPKCNKNFQSSKAGYKEWFEIRW